MALIENHPKDNKAAWPLALPFALFYLALFIYPTAQMLHMSFTDGALTIAGDWVGFDNYLKLLRDRQFGVAVLNTLYFVALTVVPGTLIALVLAMLVSRLNGIWQALTLAAFFIPYILPVTTVAWIASWLTNPTDGPLGQLVFRSNGQPYPVWRNSTLFIPAVSVLTIWWTIGFSVLVYLAGLRALPPSIYEAAQLDSAKGWTVFRRITWPLMWPVTAVLLTIQLILQLRVFDQVYLLASGGPTRDTMVLVQYIYVAAFHRNQAGYASAIAVIFFIIVLVVAALQIQARKLRSAS